VGRNLGLGLFSPDDQVGKDEMVARHNLAHLYPVDFLLRSPPVKRIAPQVNFRVADKD
jgi:hypothetical protein